MKYMKSDIIVYQAKSGAIELKGDIKHETMWATQAQIAQMFSVNPQAITKHIKNIYNENELNRKSTCSKMEQVQLEGKRTVKREVITYNLELIISVGYRINSVTGTRFRQWATTTLRQHITRGFTINKSRIKHNYDIFLSAVNGVKSLLPAKLSESAPILELIKTFANTWVSLDAYDKSLFPKSGATKKQVDVTVEMILSDINSLEIQLMKQNLASVLFAVDRNRNSIEGIIGMYFNLLANRMFIHQ